MSAFQIRLPFSLPEDGSRCSRRMIMRKPSFFYVKLAASNIRKNSKLYFPYLLACICTVAMFYIMLFVSTNHGLAEMAGADSLIVILRLGSIVIGIFSIILIFYTNGFLMKQRKRELGLYNILGIHNFSVVWSWGRNPLFQVSAYAAAESGQFPDSFWISDFPFCFECNRDSVRKHLSADTA